jgi:hypothetical protein
MLGLLLTAGLAACADSNPPPAVCSTDSAWLDGASGDELMHPGRNCVGCHVEEGGPDLAVGGTVMNAFDDDDNCNGVQGVTVQITDANGLAYGMVTNEAGNFYAEAEGVSLVPPYTAKVVYNGEERTMDLPQSDFDCGNCHTAQGAFQAPGRIVIPGVPEPTP